MRSESNSKRRNNPWNRPWIRQNDLPYLELPDQPTIDVSPEEVLRLLPDIGKELDGLLSKFLRQPDKVRGADQLAQQVDMIAAEYMDREREPIIAVRLMALHAFAAMVLEAAFHDAGIVQGTAKGKLPYHDELGIRMALHGAKAHQLGLWLALSIRDKKTVAVITKTFGVIQTFGWHASLGGGLFPMVTNPEKIPETQKKIFFGHCTGLMAPVAAIHLLRSSIFKGKAVRAFASGAIPDVNRGIDLFFYAGPQRGQVTPNLAVQVKSLYFQERGLSLEIQPSPRLHAEFLAFLDMQHFAFVKVSMRPQSQENILRESSFDIFTGEITPQMQAEGYMLRRDPNFKQQVRELLGFEI